MPFSECVLSSLFSSSTLFALPPRRVEPELTSSSVPRTAALAPARRRAHLPYPLLFLDLFLDPDWRRPTALAPPARRRPRRPVRLQRLERALAVRPRLRPLGRRPDDRPHRRREPSVRRPRELPRPVPVHGRWLVPRRHGVAQPLADHLALTEHVVGRAVRRCRVRRRAGAAVDQAALGERGRAAPGRAGAGSQRLVGARRGCAQHDGAQQALWRDRRRCASSSSPRSSSPSVVDEADS